MFQLIPRTIKKFWTASIRRQLMLGIILVHAVLMSIFVYDLVQRQKHFLQTQTSEQALSLAGTLGSNSVSWVLSNDVYGLKEVMGSLLKYPDLQYAMVLSPEGRVLGHTDFNKVGKYIKDPISVELATTALIREHNLVQNDYLVDVAVPIFSQDHHLGWARVGLGQDKIRNGLQIITRDGLIYTVIAIVIGAAFAWLMAAGITAGLRQLVQVADGIRKGNRHLRASLDRADELGDLGRDLNLMLDAIDAKEHQRSQAQRALKESESRLRSYTDALPDPIFVLDENGRYIEILNPRYHPLGLKPEQFIGQTLHNILPKDVADAILQVIRQALDSQTLQSLEYSLIIDGSQRWFEGRTVPMTGKNDGTRAVVWLARDITALKHSMEQREALQNQLFQSQKMEAIGQLTGGIAHDFNNMLASILGYTQLARDRFGRQQGGKLDDYLLQVHKAGERARNLIDQMLAYSRNAPAEPRIFQPAGILNEATKLLGSTIPASIALHVHIEDDNLSIQGDPVQLHQIIMNLVINARDALANKGTIDVGLRLASLENALCSACHQPFRGDYVEVYVQDSGSGIDAEHLQTIFEPFFSTKEVGKGTGMGLAMVHGIMHSHGGHILVESRTGAGTLMRLLFPVVASGNKTP